MKTGTLSMSTITPGVKALMNILPDDFLQWLHDKGERSNRDKFDIAMQTNLLVSAVKTGDFSGFGKYKENYKPGERPPVSVMDVYDFMSLITCGIASPRTIRYWSDVIKKFPHDAISLYAEVLPFDHFAVASHATDPVVALELAMAQTVVNYGIPPTADWLAANMNRTAAAPEPPVYEPDYISPEAYALRDRPADPSLEEDQAEPEQVSQRVSQLYEAINEIRRATVRIIDRIARGMFTDLDGVFDDLATVKTALEDIEEKINV